MSEPVRNRLHFGHVQMLHALNNYVVRGTHRALVGALRNQIELAFMLAHLVTYGRAHRRIHHVVSIVFHEEARVAPLLHDDHAQLGLIVLVDLLERTPHLRHLVLAHHVQLAIANAIPVDKYTIGQHIIFLLIFEQGIFHECLQRVNKLFAFGLQSASGEVARTGQLVLLVAVHRRDKGSYRVVFSRRVLVDVHANDHDVARRYDDAPWFTAELAADL